MLRIVSGKPPTCKAGHRESAWQSSAAITCIKPSFKNLLIISLNHVEKTEFTDSHSLITITKQTGWFP